MQPPLILQPLSFKTSHAIYQNAELGILAPHGQQPANSELVFNANTAYTLPVSPCGQYWLHNGNVGGCFFAGLCECSISGLKHGNIPLSSNQGIYCACCGYEWVAEYGPAHGAAYGISYTKAVAAMQARPQRQY